MNRQLVALLIALTVPAIGVVCSATAEAAEVKIVRLYYGPDKKPMPLTVMLPEKYGPAKKHPVVVALPPGSGDAMMVEGYLEQFWFEEANLRGYVVVAPEILGSSLEATGKDVVDAIFAYLDANVAYDPARVTLAGQSNGGRGAFFAALAAPQRFAKIIGLPAAYMGPAEDLEKLRGKPIWLLVGNRDTRWKEMTDSTAEGLRRAGAVPEVTVMDGGHVFRIAPKRLFDWMETH